MYNAVSPGKEFVFYTGHRPVMNGEVSSPNESLWVEASCPIEGLGDRCTPVHNHRFVVKVGDGESPDVKYLWSVRIVRFHIDATKRQRLITDLKLLKARKGSPHHNVSFGARLERPTSTRINHVFHQSASFRPHGLEGLIGVIEEPLFLGDLLLNGHGV
jgi:hypothetical protein